MKMNDILLIKLHFFFFLGSSGPTLPFIPVYGKQIGISSLSIGSIAAVTPILYLITKPIFGFIMDYSQWRKILFLSLFIMANSCRIMIFFLPPLPGLLQSNYFQNVSYITLPHCDMEYHALAIRSCNDTKDTTCHWICKNNNFSIQLSFYADRKEAIISPDTTCLLNINDTLYQENITNYNCNVTCDSFNNDQCQHTSVIFWIFALLMCLGNIGSCGFISLSDAVCFVILGYGKQLKYGKQRLWGTIGFGVAACLAGYLIDLWSQGAIYKSYTPSIFLVIVFSSIDLICCIKLKLSFESESTTILKDVFTLIKSKSIIIFLCVVTFVGILNSILRNFLFWYLEDLAIETGYMGNIKMIEALIIMVQTFGGEIIFFFLSGKIVKKLGYGYTITFCFICYALRLGLISLASTPWWVLSIEFLQGPSYALCLTTLVAYASVVTPPGASATVQGLVQGLNDGFGVSIGSLIGGFLYKKYGGYITLRVFSVFATFSALMYYILHTLYLKHESTDTGNNIKWSQPADDAQENCAVADT